MTACGRGAKTEPLIFIVKVEDMWKRIQEQILEGASKFVMEQATSSSWKITVYFE